MALKIVTMTISDTNRDYVVRRITNSVDCSNGVVVLGSSELDYVGEFYPKYDTFYNVTALAIRTFPTRKVSELEIVTD